MFGMSRGMIGSKGAGGKGGSGGRSKTLSGPGGNAVPLGRMRVFNVNLSDSSELNKKKEIALQAQKAAGPPPRVSGRGLGLTMPAWMKNSNTGSGLSDSKPGETRDLKEEPRKNYRSFSEDSQEKNLRDAVRSRETIEPKELRDSRELKEGTKSSKEEFRKESREREFSRGGSGSYAKYEESVFSREGRIMSELLLFLMQSQQKIEIAIVNVLEIAIVNIEIETESEKEKRNAKIENGDLDRGTGIEIDLTGIAIEREIGEVAAEGVIERVGMKKNLCAVRESRASYPKLSGPTMANYNIASVPPAQMASKSAQDTVTNAKGGSFFGSQSASHNYGAATTAASTSVSNRQSSISSVSATSKASTSAPSSATAALTEPQQGQNITHHESIMNPEQRRQYMQFYQYYQEYYANVMSVPQQQDQSHNDQAAKNNLAP